MVKNAESSQIKQSAMEVIDQADIVFENNFNNDFDEIMNEIDKQLNLSKKS